MSEWTYCKGYIEVTPFGRTQEEKEFILKTILNHLPIVDGSEEPMYTHIIKAGVIRIAQMLTNLKLETSAFT